MSLSDYLIVELKAAAAAPTPEEMRERLERLERGSTPLDHVAAVRAERGSR